MSKDDVEEYIREKMEDQRTLTADDLRGPVCAPGVNAVETDSMDSTSLDEHSEAEEAADRLALPVPVGISENYSEKKERWL